MKNLGGSPKKIFLGDGNPFGLNAERLLEVLALIHKYFPDCYDVSMDATVTNVSEKSGEELRALRDNGVSELYVGIECGLEDVLAFMRKDHDSEEARRQIARLREAGIMYSAHIMCGTAGAGRGIENAEATARFLNETGPHRIVNTSLFIHRSAPLFSDIESGRFTPATELENMLEERRLLELLTVPVDFYDGLHDYMEVRTKGRLPQDRERMLPRKDARAPRHGDRAEARARGDVRRLRVVKPAPLRRFWAKAPRSRRSCAARTRRVFYAAALRSAVARKVPAFSARVRNVFLQFITTICYHIIVTKISISQRRAPAHGSGEGSL